MQGRRKQQNGRKVPKNTRMRALTLFLALAASVVSLGTAPALALSKPALDDGFAHVKHGVLFICDTQGPNHSIASHTNWARGQGSQRVEEAIRIQVSNARRCLSRGGPSNKSNFEVGFGYLKQGTLILTETTGPRHSIESHRNWASGQSAERIVTASRRMLAGIETNLQGQEVHSPEIDWTHCADEHGVCTFSGTRKVRYGANGLYATQLFTDQTDCNNGVFGDPAPGVVKSCEYSPKIDWTHCADEHGVCSFSGTRKVRYGANGLYAAQLFTDQTDCNNGVFGDPVPGVVKSCEYSPEIDWTHCADEHGVCSFSGTRKVRYGANGLYASQFFTDQTDCNNSVFGDPASGVVKSCEYGPVVSWTHCADERGICRFSGTRDVRYGANGLYVTQRHSDQTDCNNSVFGDPVPGVAKSCEVGPPVVRFSVYGPGKTVGEPRTALLDADGYSQQRCLQECETGAHGACVAATFHNGTTCKLFSSYTGIKDSANSSKIAFIRNFSASSAECSAGPYQGMACSSDSQCGSKMECRDLGDVNVFGAFLGSLSATPTKICMLEDEDELRQAFESRNASFLSDVPTPCSQNNAFATAAQDRGEAVVIGQGFSFSALGSSSKEFGAVFGPAGQAGYYLTECAGFEFDINVSAYVTAGLYNSWSDVYGESLVTGENVSIPFIEGGYTATQVLNSAGTRVIGTQAALGIGAGVLPASLTAQWCKTAVLQVAPIVQFLGPMPAANQTESRRERCERLYPDDPQRQHLCNWDGPTAF